MLRRPSHPGNVGDTPTRPALPPTLSTFHSSDVSGALGAAPVSKKYCRRFKRLMPGWRGTWVLPMRPATLEGPKARGKRRGKSPPLGSHTKNTLTRAAAKPHSEPNPKTTGSDVAPHSGWPGHSARGAASSAGAGGLGFAEPGKGHISGLTKKTPGSGTSALRPRPGGRVANGPWAVRGNGQFSGRCLGSRGRLIETPAPQGPPPTLGTAAPEKARRQLCWVPLASHGGRTGTRLGPGTMDLPSRPIPRGGLAELSSGGF